MHITFDMPYWVRELLYVTIIVLETVWLIILATKNRNKNKLIRDLKNKESK